MLVALAQLFITSMNLTKLFKASYSQMIFPSKKRGLLWGLTQFIHVSAHLGSCHKVSLKNSI